MVYQLNEVFDIIGAGETPEVRRAKFQQAVREDPNIVWYLKMAFVPEFAITGLAHGIPEHPSKRVLVDRDIPPGMGMTTLRSEVRRILNFGPRGSMQTLSEKKRIDHWSVIIEGLQWQEVDVLTAIKDGELATQYPWLLECLDLVNISIPDPAV